MEVTLSPVRLTEPGEIDGAIAAVIDAAARDGDRWSYPS
jgi:hypothetical protein